MALERSYMEPVDDRSFDEALTYDATRTERHSTRSTFERQTLMGTISPNSNGISDVVLLAGLGSGFMNRIKRVQVTLVVPKTTTGFGGYFGFMRVPEGLGISPANVGYNDPIVLRPKLFLSNTDNATYWEAYLPAVNLVDTGTLRLIAHRSGGSASVCDFIARWIVERTST